MKIDFVTIHVADIERSITFYNRVLGMQLSRRFSPRPGLEIAFMGGSGVQVEFVHDDLAPAYSGSGDLAGVLRGRHGADGWPCCSENQVEIVSGPLT